MMRRRSFSTTPTQVRTTWPTCGRLESVAGHRSQHFPRPVARVELLGAGPLRFTRDAAGLTVEMPAAKVGDHAHGLTITPQ